MSLLPGYFILCIASRWFSSAQIRCMKKALLRHTHLLMLLIFLYYQKHILQWKKIRQSFQRSHFSFDSLHWGYSLLGNEDRNKTFNTQLTPLSYVPSYLPTANPNTIISMKINVSPLFFCLTLIICIQKTLTHLQSCCVLVDTKQVFLNMIH